MSLEDELGIRRTFVRIDGRWMIQRRDTELLTSRSS
jgi:hypothetical protein